MKINVSTRELQDGIKKLEKVVNKKAKLPVLQNVLLKANQEGITITANNIESMLVCNIKGEIQEQGLALIHHENFKLINKFKDNILEVNSTNGDKVTIKGKRNLDILQEYSPVENEETILENTSSQYEAFKINTKDLKDMLKLKIATSDNDNRPSNTGITINNNHAYAVDGYRLIKKKINISTQQQKTLFLSNNAIDILDKILGKGDDVLQVNYILTDGNKLDKLIIKNNEFTLASRCYQGEFFNAEQVIPKEFNNTLTVRSKLLLESLEFAKEIEKGMKYPVILTIKDDNMQVARNAAKKNSLEDVRINSTFINEFKIAFNVQYLIDAIKTLDVDEIEMKFVNREINPLVINSANNTEDELHLVLPVKLSKD